jgi:hypothetical protein
MTGTSIITLVLCLIAGVILGGCATGKSLPAQIPETMKEACDLYVVAKPDVLKLREYAKDELGIHPARRSAAAREARRRICRSSIAPARCSAPHRRRSKL